MAISTPDAVPGEVIEAAWGDAVRQDLTNLDNFKFPYIGGTITGSLVVDGLITANTGVALATGEPSGPGRAARRDYVDTKVAKTGDTMSGALLVGAAPSATVVGGSVNTNGHIFSTMSDPSPANLPNLICHRLNVPAGVGAQYIRFSRLSTADVTGSITITGGTSCAYNTTSDPRTKTAPSPRGINDAAARAAQLGRTAWQGQHLEVATGQPEGETWDFLSSHDIEDVAPYAVTGERDAVDDDGKPVYQQVSYGDLVPLLFAALANALDRIDALEAAA